MWRFVRAILILGLLLPEVVLAQNTSVTLTIQNNSEGIVCFVVITPTGMAREDFTDDMIHSKLIAPGQQWDIDVASGTYDVSLFNCDREALFAWNSVALTDSQILIFSPTTSVNSESDADAQVTLTIQNDSGEVICAIGIIPAGTADEDLTAEMLHVTEIGSAQHQDFGVQSGTYKVGLLDCTNTPLYVWSSVELTHSQTLTYPIPTGTDSADAASISELIEQGADLSQAGRNSEALAVLQEALTQAKQTDNRTFEGIALLAIATIYEAQSQYGDSLEQYQQALDIMRDVGNRAGEGVVLNNMGIVYTAQGQYDLAMEHLQQALDIRQEVGDQAGEAKTLNNIGNIYLVRGDYPTASEYFQQALDLTRQVGDRDEEATMLSNLGGTYVSVGQYALAEEYLEQALDIRQKAGNRRGEGTTLAQIGRLHDSEGQYALALRYYQQALDIMVEVGDRAGEGTTLSHIGSVYHAQGQYDQALEYYQQALDIMREVGNRAGEGTGLANIGSIYDAQGRYDQALENYQQALDIMRAVGNRAGEGTLLNNLGFEYSNQGQDTLALEYYQQALDIAREIGDRRGEPGYLHNIGSIYRAQGQETLALEYFQQALDIAREVGDRRTEAATLALIASLYTDPDEKAQAKAYLLQAVEVVEAIHGDIGLESGQTAFLSEEGSVFPYDALVLLNTSSDAPEQAFHYAERGRARTFLFQLENERMPFGTGADADLLNEWQTERDVLRALREQRVELASQLVPPVTSIREVDTLISDSEQSLSIVADQIALQNPVLSTFTRVDVPDLATIQAAIPEQTTILSYYMTPISVEAFIVTSTDFQAIYLDVPAEQVRAQVATFRSDEKTQTDSLSQLYEWLIAPLRTQLTTPNLVIAPHDVLNYLPFVALVNADGNALLDEFTISYAPSVTVYTLLRQNRPASTTRGTALILGNPNTPLPPLPFAEQEAIQVAEELNLPVVLGGQATEQFFRDNAGNVSIIHVAAHGSFNSHSPLSSFLALSADDQQDGYLEAREIYALPLEEYHPLVVLSACETAVGELTAGDDFQGLTRAFLLSGARAVVASLWSVDDEATSALMVEFYRNRNAGMNDAQSLAAAQQTIRKDTNHPQWENPYFWAPFLLVGLAE